MKGYKSFQKLALGAMLVAGTCTFSADNLMAADKNTPQLYLSYIFTTHHTPLLVAAKEGEKLKVSGAYFKEMVPREKYELIDDEGKSLAVFNFIVSKSGSETATMFAQDRLHIALASSTAFLSGVDKGIGIKMLAPLHVDGMSMVFPADSTVDGWADVKKEIEESKGPFKIGYHSPTSAPRIVFEGALRKAGYKITQNANDLDADILLVDLKATSNLIPALTSGQVDSWVGPAPHPSVAEYKKVGKIGLDSRDLPPKGQWENFPCCAIAASDKTIAEYPEVIQAVTDLLSYSADWSNENRAEMAELSAKWLGVPAYAIENSSIVYTTEPTQNWVNGQQMFLEILQDMNKMNGTLKDATVESAHSELFDFSFVEKTLEK